MLAVGITGTSEDVAGVTGGDDDVERTGSTMTTGVLELALVDGGADADKNSEMLDSTIEDDALGSRTGGDACGGAEGASQYSPTQWAYLSLLPASQEPSMQAAT